MYFSWNRNKLCIVIVLTISLMRQTQFLLQFSKQQQLLLADVNGSDVLLQILADNAKRFMFFNTNETTVQERGDNNDNDDGGGEDDDYDDEQDGPLFGACLKIMDENHRLPEWLAYHYYMLPLRHLIIIVDPHSETSPMEIVDRWRPYYHTIDVWNNSFLESQFEDSPFLKNGRCGNKLSPPIAAGEEKPSALSQPAERTTKHRCLQRKFYVVCSTYLRQKLGLQRQRKQQQQQQQHPTKHSNTSDIPPVWVSLHDVDEYIYLDPEIVDDAKDRMSKPGSIRTFIQDMAQQQQQPLNKLITKNRRKAAKLSKFANQSFQSRCLMMARSLYGAAESSNNNPTTSSSSIKIIPEFINVSDFETLRYRHRESHRNVFMNGPGKSMALFGHYPGISSEENFNFAQGIHDSFRECHLSQSFSPIRIRHYLGSWEVFTSRVDARIGNVRSRELYLFHSKVGENLPPDNAVESWMQGFCRQFDFNQTLIQHLLQGAGKLPAQTQEIRQMNWSMSPELIRNYMTKRRRRDPLFAEWLRERYEIVDQPNNESTIKGGRKKKSVIVVKVKNPNETEPYPYSFPPLDQ